MSDYDGSDPEGDIDGDGIINSEDSDSGYDEHDSHEVHDMWGNDMHQLPDGSWATEMKGMFGSTEYVQNGHVVTTEGKDTFGNDVLLDNDRNVTATEMDDSSGNNVFYGADGSITTELDGYGGVVFVQDSGPNRSDGVGNNSLQGQSLDNDAGGSDSTDTDVDSDDYSSDSDQSGSGFLRNLPFFGSQTRTKRKKRVSSLGYSYSKRYRRLSFMDVVFTTAGAVLISLVPSLYFSWVSMITISNYLGLPAALLVTLILMVVVGGLVVVISAMIRFCEGLFGLLVTIFVPLGWLLGVVTYICYLLLV